MASSLGLALLAVAASESMDAMRVAVLEHRVQKRLTGKRWGFDQQKMGISPAKNGNFTSKIDRKTKNLDVRHSLYNT
jgi:hypothetical protein